MELAANSRRQEMHFKIVDPSRAFSDNELVSRSISRRGTYYRSGSVGESPDREGCRKPTRLNVIFKRGPRLLRQNPLGIGREAAR